MVEEALTTIRRDGVDGLTLRAIGTTLGVSRTALYRHFPDKSALLRAVGALTLAASCLHAQQFRTGTVAKRYEELCSNCHGKEMEGAQAPSMLDDIWVHGGDDESLARSIRNGFPDKGMPAWSAALPEKEIRAMVIYIRETRAKKALDALPTVWDEGENAKVSQASILKHVSSGLDSTDAFADINDGDVTAALAGAAKKVQATYAVPFIQIGRASCRERV